jgi:SAM-dependent methyltransferase
MPSLFERATNPQQYDHEGTYQGEVGLNESYRRWFYGVLARYSCMWPQSSVLEIGCGTGWLLNECLKAGAAQATGIEPSRIALRLAAEHYSRVRISNVSFLEFNSDEEHNLVIALMVLPHFADLDSVFAKIRSLLDPYGEVQLIVPDYDYFRTPRHNYKIKIEELDDKCCIVETRRSKGTIVDIIRKVEVYHRSANKNRFACVEEVPVKPTAGLIREKPCYEALKDTTMIHLLRYRREDNPVIGLIS